MQRQRISADYLQTSAVIDADGLVHSAVNDPNEYSGPGTGLPARRGALGAASGAAERRRPRRARSAATRARARSSWSEERRYAAATGWRSSSASGRAFADTIRSTINDLPHEDVLAAICEGMREAGATPRVVRVRRVADVAFIAHDGARLSGSGVALGIQSKGTAVIHRADLEPLDNLELFGMSPLYTLDSYRAMGRNAAGYALGRRVGPVPTELDNFARAKLIVKTTLLHARETQAVQPGAAPVELELAVPVRRADAA